MNKPFENLVGQDRIKRRLSFYIDVYKKTSVVPFVNFIGAKGLGKTSFAREFSKHLKTRDGNDKKFYEIASASIKSITQFLDQIYDPHIRDKEVVIFFDECHALPQSMMYALLTILNTQKDPIRYYNTGDQIYEFDFSKIHFLFATTESHELFSPLKDRLTSVDFVDYTVDELKSIFKFSLPKRTFEHNVLKVLAEDLNRGNARSCVLKAEEVNRYCETYDINHITMNHLESMRFILDFLPKGLNHIELQILQVLKEYGSASLSMLAAKTGLSRGSIQKDHEVHLLKKGLINIEGLRKITNRGLDLLKEERSYRHG